MSSFVDQTFSEIKFGKAINFLDSLSAASINKHRSKDKVNICALDPSIINGGSQISSFTKCFLNQQVFIVDLCIDSGFCSPFAAAVSIIQGNPNPLCERGASLKRNLVIAGNDGDYCRICRPLDPVLLVFSGQKSFWKHLHLQQTDSSCDK